MSASDVHAEQQHRHYQRGFWALIITQFQGAFNDNAFKLLICYFLLRASLGTGSDAQDEALATQISSLAALLFAVPWILFPGYAGALADRFSKQKVTVWTKYWELLVMVVGFVAFRLGSTTLLWTMLFMMSMQSAFFSPAKYGILPEFLPEKKLSWANGMLQMFTFLAIILGTAAPGWLRDRLGDRTYLAAVPLITLSFIGLMASRQITRPPAANPQQRIPLNPWSGIGKYLKLFLADRWLFLTMLGIAYFWFAGVMVQTNILRFGIIELDLAQDKHISFLLASLAAGIGIGSVASGYLSHGRIEPGLIPPGALGLAVFSGFLAWPGFNYTACLGLLFGLGFFAGFYVVPLNAVLQYRSPTDVKGGMIATNNFVCFAGMAAASGLFWLSGEAGLNSYHIFLVVAIMTLVVGIYICTLLPMFLLRFLLWIPMSTLYRIKTVGHDNVPQRGGALLVANHMSFVDALVLTASTDRLVRFIMAEEFYNTWWARPICKIMRAIPISARSGPRDLINSLKTATEAIQQGDLVCIFAEGQISRTGQLLPFRKGFERIMKGVDAPIIPVHLDRLWGSIFSFEGERFFWKLPRQLPFPITVSYGAPMPARTGAPELRNAIQELGTDAYMTRAIAYPLLHRAFIAYARRHPRQMAVADGRTPKLSYFKTLVGSIVLARKLRRLLDDEPMTGVLVPPSVGGALVNVALQIMGKVPINLNYTASADGLASSAQQCNIRHVITSKEFLQRLPLQVPGEAIYLEDIMASVKGSDRLVAALMAIFCARPVWLIERLLGAPGGRSQDDLATIIFSSGSEGDPKGVMLTHFNITSNIEAALQVFPHERGDALMGILPFFHSFGFTGTLWLTLTRGFRSVYHPNPLDAKAIGGLTYKYKAKFLIATATFLQNFIRRCLPEEFSSLQYVVTGAEKLPARVREAFRAKFGVEPLEGYGTTECAPIVSINVPDFRAPGFFQRGTKHGTIGQPLPGISVRIVDPDTEELLPLGEAGMLQVKGPNIMKGYLGMPERTAEVLKDGWYTTGDIAKLDEEGFITITDRLSRFSKIGGEMVPHNTVEEKLHALLGITEQVIAITGVPDESKGERLVALHTLDEEQLDELQNKMAQCDLPRLWLPKTTAFYRVQEIPTTGTGKIDIKKVRDLARQFDLGE